MTNSSSSTVHHFPTLDPRFDFEAAKRFIGLLRGDANTAMHFRTLTESAEAKGRQEHSTPEELAQLRRNYSGSLAQLAPLLQKKNKAGCGVFIALNEFDGNGRKKENLIAAHVVPLDLDGTPLPTKWVIEPHWIHETSPGRFQCFFVIERTNDIAAVEDITRRLAAFCGGDLNVCDATHIFRVPGFYHQKRDKFQVHPVHELDFDPPYRLSDFDFLPELEKRGANEVSGIGNLSADLAEELLDQLDVSHFSNNEAWTGLAMALHAASGADGEVRELFLDWSDQAFEKDYSRTTNLGRWNSFSLKKASLKGFGTLLKISREHGVRDDTLRKLSLATDLVDFSADVRDLSTIAAPMLWNMTHAMEMIGYAEDCMRRGGAPLYQTGGRMVYPVRTEHASSEDEGIRRPSGALTVHDIKPPRMELFMIEHARFVKPLRGDPSRLVPQPATEKLGKLYLNAPDLWRLPTLNGIIETPTLRADGTLLTEPGYDARSGLLLDMGDLKLPEIPESPTRAEALTALAELKEPFADFPFVPDGHCGKSASRSVMLSVVLTGLVRRTLPSAPMHGISAPTPGTGKSLAVQAAAMIIMGRSVTAMSQGASEEEDEKRLFTVFMQGDQMVSVDNVTRAVGGDALCTILTEPTWQSRVLGESRNVSVNTNVLLTSTGNNLAFAGDMTRRAILCRMDAEIENPEGRSFEKDLRVWVPHNRGRLVAAGLTVLRAYVVAKRPGLDRLQPFGSFEGWSNLVRGALVWLGELDPCITRQHILADDARTPCSYKIF
ncbi:PriCT-2 domain-containing protein [Bradyrhizobium sp. AUGA SZCCT0182]|uniref:PriCT-2 domain-containing protein n=1 Tax=Bradyrhizobium sp. AUGA SZCCT0182 TaxID=2807667 RepID=UPI001BAE180B|nr:DNA-primase RepB domain-containing protein [Bradyrhizobium sp. AUGA SZCCT0182]MBR1236542.1 PriCT-2 domain-containing protein [Bradyrhizobium sp. AUGA SZCCT0182]